MTMAKNIPITSDNDSPIVATTQQLKELSVGDIDDDKPSIELDDNDGREPLLPVHSFVHGNNNNNNQQLDTPTSSTNGVVTSSANEDEEVIHLLHNHNKIESDVHSSLDSDDERTNQEDEYSEDGSEEDRYETDDSDDTDSDVDYFGMDALTNSSSNGRLSHPHMAPSSPSSSSSLSSSTSNLPPAPHHTLPTPSSMINHNAQRKSKKMNKKKSSKSNNNNNTTSTSSTTTTTTTNNNSSSTRSKKDKDKKKEKGKGKSKSMDGRDSLDLGKDKKIHSLIRSEANSPLFSPTEFVKGAGGGSSSHQHHHHPPQPLTTQHNLSSSLMGFRNLGCSNILQNQNPQIIPSGSKPLLTTLMGSGDPNLGRVLPDPEYLPHVWDEQDNVFIVPTCSHPILDIDNLFSDVSVPAGGYPSTPGDSTPRLLQSQSVGDILSHPSHTSLQSTTLNHPSMASSYYQMPNNAGGSSLNNSTAIPKYFNSFGTTSEQQQQQQQQVPGMDNDLPLDIKILQLSGSRHYFNRELTELIYFYRILYEAYNPAVPVIEKLRFLAITSQNIDMYFCKRALKLRLGFISTRKSLKPEEKYINMVLNTTRNLINDKYNLFNNKIVPELAANNVNLLKYDDLQDGEKYQLRAFFLQHVFPLMTPLVVDAGHPFPNLSNLSLNIAVVLQHDEEGHTRFVRIKVPLKIPRFVHIKQRQPYSLIPMEEIILANLDTLFPNTKLLTKCLFRVTRHYDLKLNEDDANDLLELIKTELHKRKFAPMVRLEVSASMPKDILDMLITQLHLDDADVYIIDGLLGLADLFEICKLNLPHLKFEPWIPHIPSRLVNLSKYPQQDIFSVIRKGELLVQLPYVSFNSSVQLFIESAVKDPKVLAIKIAIYRTSSNSQLIRALCEAASHKEVSVLVDLKASGDEEQNTKYARLLEQAGCHVSYGLVGLKTHCKIAMVVREEENGLREYLHYSTGNYNSSTADIYVDMCLFSCDQQLGADMCDLFNYLTGYSRITSFRKLLIAPMNMRSTLIQLIETEARNAREGKEASILAVMNGLDDKRIVNALYHASVAGVTIKLVVRGRCRILPGIPGISHNISVISILGRFLEHSRIYYFSNGGAPKAYIASADWLHRNLKRRVETLVPVEDPANIKELRSIIDVYINDPTAWEMLPDGRYKKVASNEHASLASQNVFVRHTINTHPIIWSK
ncbi:polyphosphate kinase [Cavenderia fasciculata]|uniref:ATP-polyphosphate phosphotransferase n=1 Tax=Cavenderia fasciculata TaxID=261658 RepID=F4PUB3_CACFS|nr:polyphosphate kinase [Cavenderia fasciculata]EGG21828.1 polyphosphate kinase [Cavenderia fasciculata]|eukprot:XP_004359678.1 polyphosphate kinase [Cavenderia fasciculata]